MENCGHKNDQQHYAAPVLTHFGSVSELTAGGSRPNGVEFIFLGCQSKQSIFRC